MGHGSFMNYLLACLEETQMLYVVFMNRKLIDENKTSPRRFFFSLNQVLVFKFQLKSFFKTR